jgi:putative flippase GtrA
MKNILKINEFIKILKDKKSIFLILGGINTFVSWVSFYLFYPLLKEYLDNSSILFIHFSAMMIFNFFNYNIFLYKVNDNLIKRFTKFYFIRAIFVPITIIVFNILNLKLGLHYFICHVLITLFMIILTFLTNRYFVFKIHN